MIHAELTETEAQQIAVALQSTYQTIGAQYQAIVAKLAPKPVAEPPPATEKAADVGN
jgi:hypothetical protein